MVRFRSSNLPLRKKSKKNPFNVHCVEMWYGEGKDERDKDSRDPTWGQIFRSRCETEIGSFEFERRGRERRQAQESGKVKQGHEHSFHVDQRVAKYKRHKTMV